MKIIRLNRLKLFAIALGMAIASVTSIPVASVFAEDEPTSNTQCDEQFYSANDILFYNPCETTCSVSSGALTGPAPTALVGESNPEKTWNYFTARGLTPVAAAGAMGNISHESGFSASVEEASGGGGLGIIQWTGDRRTKLEQAASAAGVNLADNDSALLFELNYLWDGEYDAMTWQEPMNAEKTVEGNTAIASYNSKFAGQRAESQAGNGSTMLFHALIERSNDVPTKADQYPGVGVLTGRIDKAKEFLEQFSGSSASGGSCNSVGAGGLTWDQAVTLGKKIVDNWDANYCGNGSVKAGFYCSWTSGYCTAGAAWMAVTTAPDPSKVPGIPDGVNVANRLVSSNPDVYTSGNPDGSNVQPFSVWSFGAGSSSGAPGHTGTIVGVGKDGSIITLETNWAGETAGATNSFLYNPGHKVAVFQYPSFEAFKSSRNGYVYNGIATPKDSLVASLMAQKITAYIGN